MGNLPMIISKILSRNGRALQSHWTKSTWVCCELFDLMSSRACLEKSPHMRKLAAEIDSLSFVVNSELPQPASKRSVCLCLAFWLSIWLRISPILDVSTIHSNEFLLCCLQNLSQKDFSDIFIPSPFPSSSPSSFLSRKLQDCITDILCNKATMSKQNRKKNSWENICLSCSVLALYLNEQFLNIQTIIGY